MVAGAGLLLLLLGTGGARANALDALPFAAEVLAVDGVGRLVTGVPVADAGATGGLGPGDGAVAAAVAGTLLACMERCWRALVGGVSVPLRAVRLLMLPLLLWLLVAVCNGKVAT